MQRLRVFLATFLLSITGFAVFGLRAFASPGSAGTIPPQACSTGTSGGGVTGTTGGYTGYSGYTGTGTTGGGGTGGTTTGTGTGSSNSTNPQHIKRQTRVGH